MILVWLFFALGLGLVLGWKAHSFRRRVCPVGNPEAQSTWAEVLRWQSPAERAGCPRRLVQRWLLRCPDLSGKVEQYATYTCISWEAPYDLLPCQLVLPTRVFAALREVLATSTEPTT